VEEIGYKNSQMFRSETFVHVSGQAAANAAPIKVKFCTEGDEEEHAVLIIIIIIINRLV